MNSSRQPLFKEEDGKRRRVTASPFQRKKRKELGDSTSSSDDDTITANDEPGSITLMQRRGSNDDDSDLSSADDLDTKPAARASSTAVACYDLCSSSSDDEENKCNGITTRKKKPSTGAMQQRATGQWLTSLNSRRDYDDDSASSSDEDDDDIIDTKPSMGLREWLTSSTSQTKLDHLTKIESSADKALQLLLWEIGFGYNVLGHQFEAIRFVAGVVRSFPLAASKNDNNSDLDSDDSSAEGDSNEINEMLALDLSGEMKRSNALKQPTNLIKTRGCLLADEMGLGKTIEALGGAVLRNHLNTTKGKAKTKRPTLIVTPQDGIQQQWYETLRKAGVEPARIFVMGEAKKDTKARGGKQYKSSSTQEGVYLLCTRYKVQSELKKLFEQTANLKSALDSSILFQHIPAPLIKKLQNQYLAEKGKADNKYIRRRERRQDCITRLIRSSFNDEKASFKIAFNSVIIDECHFLKNVLAYWGMGAALLGGQAKRTILLSGTPYNNGPSDMSALMTFIDPRNEAAQLNWWEKAVGKGRKRDVIEAVGHWRIDFMLRREKTILKGLPKRERKCVNISAFPAELFVYENYEFAFLSALNKLQEAMDDGSPASIRRQRELCEIMMACMSCMRMALIHPMIPGGREITIQLSPSRKHLLDREENKEKCVLCSGRSYPTQRAELFAARRAAEENGDEFIVEDDYLNFDGADAHVRTEMDLDDDDLDDEDVLIGSNTRENKEKGKLVELNHDICRAAGSDCRHFAHEKCLAAFLENGCSECPRCYDLSSRIHISNKEGAGKVDHRVYCSNTKTSLGINGFTASTKIVKAIEWFQTTVPDDEKAIILSFFKGSLDLVEAILTDELGIDCARYDGDVGKETRAEDLKRFQTSSTCRVLLASVQSGGTGLNITQANHVCFLDRWFNPQVHDQAESRVHRIGQKKDCKISYLDVALSVDSVMKIVNEYKLDNASVLLADGSSLGGMATAVGYKDLSGLIGNSMKAIRDMRRNAMASNEVGLPLALPFGADQLFDKVQEVLNSRPIKAKKERKEDYDETSVSSSESKADGYESEDSARSDKDMSESAKAKGGKTAIEPSRQSKVDGYESEDSAMSDKDLSNSAKDKKTAIKPERWAESQGSSSSSSNDSFLNYDVRATSVVKHDANVAMLPASQESLSSYDSILDYDIFSSEKSSKTALGGDGLEETRSAKRPVHDLEQEQLEAAIHASLQDTVGEQPSDDGNDDGASVDDDIIAKSGEDECQTTFKSTADDEDNDANINGDGREKEDESKLSPFEREILFMTVPDEPTTAGPNIAKVQLRMPNGKRIVRKFCGDSPVKVIYAFVAQLESNIEDAKAGRPFELKAKYPPMDLMPFAEDSIMSSGLSGEAITFVWK